MHPVKQTCNSLAMNILIQQENTGILHSVHLAWRPHLLLWRGHSRVASSPNCEHSTRRCATSEFCVVWCMSRTSPTRWIAMRCITHKRLFSRKFKNGMHLSNVGKCALLSSMFCRLLMVGIQWLISTCRPLMVYHTWWTMLGYLMMVDIH